MKLAPPGSGLPEQERLGIKNFLVPMIRILFTWNLALWFLKREIKIIEQLVSQIPREKCTQKVLINRTFGIEDDTRQFSINLVLEHLVIAGQAVQMVIQKLSQEEEIPMPIKIEAVKPKENKLDQIDDFLKFYHSYFDFIENLPKKQSKMTKAHPWFIKFNNYDWSVFMYMHTFIHRRQLQAIMKELV